MDEESGEVAVSADPWPHALSGLRHSDQLRAILAGMPRPAGARDVDWAERAEMVRSRTALQVLEPPPPALEVGGFAIEPIEPIEPSRAPEVTETTPVDDGDVVPFRAEDEDLVEIVEVVAVPAPAAVAYEPLRHETPLAVPAPPQPILWVPSSAFEGAPPVAVPLTPAADAHPVPPMVPLAVPAARPDPRFVPVPAAGLAAPGTGLPTTAWTMRLGFGDPQPVPRPIAATESMNVPHRRRRWRRAAVVVVVVVVLAAAAVAGWMVWRHRMAANHPSPAAIVARGLLPGTVPASLR